MNGREQGRTDKPAIPRPSGDAPPAPAFPASRTGLFSFFLIVTVFAAYLPALNGGFVWDDDSWTTGLQPFLTSFRGLRWMWTKPGVLQQYYPLTGSTFWLDYHLWGFWTLPYHLENVVLHAAAAWLLWRLLFRFNIRGAWLAAAIFALHPVMVESTAWITERKNVLSLVLYLASLLAYGHFVRFWDSVDTPVTPGCFDRLSPDHARIIAFFLFVASVLAKTTSFSLPAVILLLCWWKRGRIRWREDVVPTIPFLLVSVIFGLLVAGLEKNHLNAKGPEWDLMFQERCVIAGRAFWFYIGKLLWPVNLCFLYPRWHPDIGSFRQWLYPISAVVALLALWLGRRQIGRGPATALFFYVGTLFPVMGFMDAYGMRYSFVWDHWVYLSSIGIIVLFASVAARIPSRSTLGVAAFLLLGTLSVLTWRQRLQLSRWRNSLERHHRLQSGRFPRSQ